MSRGLFRKISFNKMVGAYRSQWKRFWLRLFTFGAYGRKGMGWLRDPQKAIYNRVYYRTSVSIPELLGYKPSWFGCFCAMFVASIWSIFASPVDIAQAGITVHQMKAERKAQTPSTDKKSIEKKSGIESEKKNASATATRNPNTSKGTSGTLKPHQTTAHKNPNVSKNTPKTKSATSASQRASAPISSSATSTKPRVTATASKTKFTYQAPIKTVTDEKPKISNPTVPTVEHNVPAKPITEQPKKVVVEPDENTPKSKPKYEKDQYIRKRMIIAGSSYCEKSVLDKLTIGTYIELLPEPTNAYDKNAIMLIYDGNKVGYIAKEDNMMFGTCLRIGRKVYGVITDIKTESATTKYEYETWFDLERR